MTLKETINPNNDEELNAKILNSLKFPVALLPTQFEDRIRAQNACFTIHGGKKTCSEENLEEEYSLQNLFNFDDLEQVRSNLGLEPNNMPILFKAKIPWDKKHQIKEDLVDNIGIDDSNLFLDRDSYAKCIKQKWRFFKPISDHDNKQNQQADNDEPEKRNGNQNI